MELSTTRLKQAEKVAAIAEKASLFCIFPLDIYFTLKNWCSERYCKIWRKTTSGVTLWDSTLRVRLTGGHRDFWKIRNTHFRYFRYASETFAVNITWNEKIARKKNCRRGSFERSKWFSGHAANHFSKEQWWRSAAINSQSFQVNAAIFDEGVAALTNDASSKEIFYRLASASCKILNK